MVDCILVEKILADIRSQVNDLRSADDITWEVYRADKRSRRFVKRTLQILIEACIDIAQHIISENHFREPTSYRDTFSVLAEEGVISRDYLPKFEQMAAFRNLIVHYYEPVDDADDAVVYGVFQKRLEDFELFADLIVRYLEKK